MLTAVTFGPADARQRVASPAGLPFAMPHDTAGYRTLLAVEDRRAREPGDVGVLETALQAPDPALRRVAVRALGRLERPDLTAAIVTLLGDPVASVRSEAANALAQSGSGLIVPLVQRLDAETDPGVLGAMAEALGRMGTRNATSRAIERALLRIGTGDAGREAGGPSLPVRVGAARGLYAWARTRPDSLRSPLPGTVQLLETLAVDGTSLTGEGPNARWRSRVRRLAIGALARLHALPGPILDVAMDDRDAGVRRVAVAALTGGSRADIRRYLARGLSDQSPAVRFEAFRVLRRTAAPEDVCRHAVDLAGDDDDHVALAALDALGACHTPAAQTVLRAAADSEPAGGTWHRRAHAVVSLAGADPEAARNRLPLLQAAANPWLRTWAARAAARLGDSSTLARLATDENDNVRESAVRGMFALRGHTVDSTLIAQLKRSDYQLVRTAAGLLAGSPRPQAVWPALRRALRRITAERRETSRDARWAILDRMAEFGDGERARDLEPYLHDFDPVIAARTARMLDGWGGTRTSAAPRPLPPVPLPTPADLGRLRGRTLTMTMHSGSVVRILLLPIEAPTNVTRFVDLAESGYFDHLSLHRVVPNFVVQGGSPGANEYVGAGAFSRDELGRRGHWRGTVGISTRGRDTGDAQIFVNLVDNPRLDHNYTIVGIVVDGMAVIDEVLEGATIARIRLDER